MVASSQLGLSSIEITQKHLSVLLAIVNVARRWNVALSKLSLNKTVIFVVVFSCSF